jgi:hypothetical protein
VIPSNLSSELVPSQLPRRRKLPLKKLLLIKLPLMKLEKLKPPKSPLNKPN